MAGRNPGMVIVVAADITEAKAAFKDIAEATGEVQTAAKETTTGMIAMGSAIGNIAADAASALVDLVADAVQVVGKQLWQVVDAATGVSEAFGIFKTDISEVLRESGVLQAGIDSLGNSILAAFGGTREEAIARIARLIQDGAIAVLDFTEDLITFGEIGARAITALIVPIDAVLLAMAYVGERFAALNAFLAETAAKIPVVGDQFKGFAENARTAQQTYAGWKDEAQRVLDSHVNLVQGQGELFTWTGKTRDAIQAARNAMLDQQDAADAAATSTRDLADAGSSVVDGNAALVMALADQTDQLAAMDRWALNIKDKDPLSFLTQGLERTVPPFKATTEAAVETAAALEDVGTEAIDMSDDVRFAAEVVERASLSWNDAMDAVRRGEGTMSGQVSGAKPANVSDAEWQQRLTDPAQWQLLHGYEWQSANAGAWRNLPGFGANTSGNSQVNNITVNSVAGDKQAIAAVVKDALADDWRSTGLRG